MKLTNIFAIGLLSLLGTLANANTNIPLYNIPIIGASELVLDDPEPVFGCYKKSYNFSSIPPDVFGKDFLCPGLTCEMDLTCEVNTILLFKYSECCENAKTQYANDISAASTEYNNANNALWDAYLACVQECMAYGPPSPSCLAACCNTYTEAEEDIRSTATRKENKAFTDYKAAIQACVVEEDFCDDLDDCCE